MGRCAGGTAIPDGVHAPGGGNSVSHEGRTRGSERVRRGGGAGQKRAAGGGGGGGVGAMRASRRCRGAMHRPHSHRVQQRSARHFTTNAAFQAWLGGWPWDCRGAAGTELWYLQFNLHLSTLLAPSYRLSPTPGRILPLTRSPGRREPAVAPPSRAESVVMKGTGQVVMVRVGVRVMRVGR
jgi:hypothetical protein